jgi:hypothetical protein
MLHLTDLPSDPNGHTTPIKRAGVQLVNQCRHYPKKRAAVTATLQALLEALEGQETVNDTDVPVQPKEATEGAPVKPTTTKKRRATAKTGKE